MKVWSVPQSTDSTPAVPAGVIVPPVAWVTAIVFWRAENVTARVWFATTLVKLYGLVGVIETPSTIRLATWWQASGVIVNDWLALQLTATLPDGVNVPPALADAAIV